MKMFYRLLFLILVSIWGDAAAALSCSTCLEAWCGMVNGSCQVCPAGTENSGQPQWYCKSCDVGYYRSANSANGCKQCTQYPVVPAGLSAKSYIAVSSSEGSSGATSEKECSFVIECTGDKQYVGLDLSDKVECKNCPSLPYEVNGLKLYAKKIYKKGYNSTDSQIKGEKPCRDATDFTPITLQGEDGWPTIYAVKDGYEWRFSLEKSSNANDYTSECDTNKCEFKTTIPNKDVITDSNLNYISGWVADGNAFLYVTVDGTNCGQSNSGDCPITVKQNKLNYDADLSPKDATTVTLNREIKGKTWDVLIIPVAEEKYVYADTEKGDYICPPEFGVYVGSGANTMIYNGQEWGIVCQVSSADNAKTWVYQKGTGTKTCTQLGYKKFFMGGLVAYGDKLPAAGYYGGCYCYDMIGYTDACKCVGQGYSQSIAPQFAIAQVVNCGGRCSGGNYCLQLVDVAMKEKPCNFHLPNNPVAAINNGGNYSSEILEHIEISNPDSSQSSPLALEKMQNKYILIGFFYREKCRPGCYCSGIWGDIGTMCPDVFTSDTGATKNTDCYIKPDVKFIEGQTDVTDLLKDFGIDMQETKFYLSPQQ